MLAFLFDIGWVLLCNPLCAAVRVGNDYDSTLSEQRPGKCDGMMWHTRVAATEPLSSCWQTCLTLGKCCCLIYYVGSVGSVVACLAKREACWQFCLTLGECCFAQSVRQ